jgi:hypothetical protein
MTSETTSPATNIELVRAGLEAFNAGKVGECMALPVVTARHPFRHGGAAAAAYRSQAAEVLDAASASLRRAPGPPRRDLHRRGRNEWRNDAPTRQCWRPEPPTYGGTT